MARRFSTTNRDLYGREIRVDFVARLRDEKKFKNADELREQMTEDVAHGKRVLQQSGLIG